MTDHRVNASFVVQWDGTKIVKNEDAVPEAFRSAVVGQLLGYDQPGWYQIAWGWTPLLIRPDDAHLPSP